MSSRYTVIINSIKRLSCLIDLIYIILIVIDFMNLSWQGNLTSIDKLLQQITTIKGDHTMAQTLINTKVTDFKVQAYHNNSFKTVTSADLNGKWSVFFFYPADFTFVCPTELGDMADKYSEFQKLGVEVYGVSTDTHFTHKAWHDTSETIKKIKYPMLADPTGHLSRAFGVYIEEAGMAYRGTFLVNPEGHIKLAEINDNGIGRNADELLRKVQAAQFVAAHPNEVCPAKWTPGAKTLKPGLDLVGKI
jgi:NADH-dependent peroxiredoxin subunit C